MKKIAYPLAYDVGGVVFIGLGLLVLLSLSSYSSADSSIPIYGASSIQNWIGPGGALTSHFLFTVFGFLAFFVPGAFFYGGARMLMRKNVWENPAAFVGGSFLVFSLVTILDVTDVFKERVSFLPGGVLGRVLSESATQRISVTGTMIIALSVFLIGLVLFTGSGLIENFSRPREWIAKFGDLFSRTRGILLKKRTVAVEEKKEFSLGSFAIHERNKAFDISAPPKVIVLPAEEDSLLGRNSGYPSGKRKSFTLPPLKLLDYDAAPPVAIDESHLRSQAQRLEKTFEQFGVTGHVREIRPGPVVTLFEFVPSPGIKLTKIASLADDIAMAMVAMHVRIVAPMPGKGAVGIEIPNEKRELVYLKEIVSSPNFKKDSHPLCMALGKTIEGKPFFANLAEMPHVLIAGTTGSGKSVSVNGMICSILYRATPDDVRFIFIDPKMLELSIYDGIPHLLMPPIIDSKKAANALKWAVREMDHRYQLLNELGVRDIDSYNLKCAKDMKMSYIVIVVDEYADLISVAGQEVENYVMRLAQKARACGIHVMLATQRPSVDIITGVIKANFPVRIGFRLASVHDSKTIINRSGAESLLGRGDMLLIPPGTSDLVRVHGAYVSEKELSRVVDFWKAQGQPNYDPTLVSATEESPQDNAIASSSNQDEKYMEAIDVVLRTQKCSTSWLQRQLGVGYNRAARLVEQMEKEGIVGPIQNAKGEREIFGSRGGESVFPS